MYSYEEFIIIGEGFGFAKVGVVPSFLLAVGFTRSNTFGMINN